MAEVGQETIRKSSKDVSRTLRPRIEAELKAGYEEAVAMSGKGSVQRQKVCFVVKSTTLSRD